MYQKNSRRTFIAAAATALAAPAILMRPGWALTSPIKIGTIEPRSGPSKYVGDANIAAIEFVVDQVNASGGLLGRQVEIVVGESEFKPDVGGRRASEMLLGEKVDFLSALGGAVAKIVAQKCFEAKKLFISPHTVPSEMTGAEFIPTTFVCSLTTEMLAASLAAWAVKQPHTRVFLINQDYANGRNAGAAFKKKFNQAKRDDQLIVGEEYHPLFKLNDFAPYVTKIMAAGADLVMSANWGPDLRLLLQQGAQLGWKVKLAGFFLNDPTLTQAVKDAAVGHVTTGVHMITVDTPENKALIEKWRAKFPEAPIFYRVPDLITGRGVNAWSWLFEVIRRAGSLDAETLIKTWEGSSFRAPWGDVKMRGCDHQMLSPCFVAEVMQPAAIPEAIRYYGNDFPYIGTATTIPAEVIVTPAVESGNKRCSA